MDQPIIPSREFLKTLSSKYVNIDFPMYKFRDWYSEKNQVFFDCDGSNIETCLMEILEREDYSGFEVFSIIRDRLTGSYTVMDVVYPNAFNQSLDVWIDKYHKVLKSGCYMILEGQGKEYVVHLGVSYTD